jgi:hypothetical protein
MEQYNSPQTHVELVAKKLYFNFVDQELRLTKELNVEARRINKKSKKSLPLNAKVIHGASELKTPTIILLARAKKPGSKHTQFLRPFETEDDLLKPENLFCSPEEVIKLAGDELQVIKLLNETSKLIQAAQRKLKKVFKEL